MCAVRRQRSTHGESPQTCRVSKHHHLVSCCPQRTGIYAANGLKSGHQDMTQDPAHPGRLVNQASASVAVISLAAPCVGSSSSSSSSSHMRPTDTTRHAWLGPRSTRAQRLLISGSTPFLQSSARTLPAARALSRQGRCTATRHYTSWIAQKRHGAHRSLNRATCCAIYWIALSGRSSMPTASAALQQRWPGPPWRCIEQR